MRISLVWCRKQFSWRMTFVRLLLYGLLICIVAGLLPGISFVNPGLMTGLIVAITFGVLLSVVKPLLQIVTLPMMFVSYGLVLIAANALILWLLAALLPGRLALTSLWAALWGGLIIGLLGGFLESVMGLTMPIVPESEEALRERIRAQDRGILFTHLARRKLPPASRLPGPAPSGAAPGPIAAAPRAPAEPRAVAPAPEAPL